MSLLRVSLNKIRINFDLQNNNHSEAGLEVSKFMEYCNKTKKAYEDFAQSSVAHTELLKTFTKMLPHTDIKESSMLASLAILEEI